MLQLVFSPLLNLEVDSAFHHVWPAGFALQHPSLHYNLWLVEAGEVRVVSGEQNWELKIDAFLVPVHFARHITCDAGATLLSIGYRSPSLNQKNFFDGIRLPIQWKPSTPDRRLMRDWMKRIVQNCNHPELDQQLVYQGLGTAVLGVCWTYLCQSELAQPARRMLPAWLSKVLHRMKEHPNATIAELAHFSGLSPSQFRKNFHLWMGAPPQKYLKAQRLETARLLLQTSDLTLRVVAETVGYKNATHLSASFEKRYGLRPSNWRLQQLQAALRENKR